MQQADYRPQGGPDLSGGGLVTFPNLFAVPSNGTPNSIDVKFSIGGVVEKRLGSSVRNVAALMTTTAAAFLVDSNNTLAVLLTAYYKLEEQSGSRVDSIDNQTLTDNNTVGFAAGRRGDAALFVAANSESLSVGGDNGVFNAGSLPITIASWVYLVTNNASQTFVGKWMAQNTANREYRLWYDQDADRIAWTVRNVAGTEVTVRATTLGAPATATWYLLTAYWDSAGAVSVLRTNTNGAQSLGVTGALVSGSADFSLGVQHGNIGFSVDTASNLRASLQAYWTMEEASGARRDQSGNGLHLGDRGTGANPVAAAGQVGSAVSLVRANSQSLDIASVPELQSGPINFTLSTWVYITTAVSEAPFICKGSDSAAANYEYYLFYDPTSDRCGLQISNGTSELSLRANTYGAVPTATWLHLVGWHDSANGLLGISVNDTADTTAWTSGGNATNTFFHVGRQPPTRYLDGRIDETGFWKRTLTAAERTNLYRSGSGNRFATDYASARIDEVGVWHKVLTAQQQLDLWAGSTGNTYSTEAGFAGWGSYDFGASRGADGKPLRWHVVAAGTGILASSNQGLTYVAIATNRGTNYQRFERSKNLLIATSETMNRVLYWAGSVGTFMLGLPVGSAPAAKHALDYAGFLLLMNHSGGSRQVVYGDNNNIPTDPFNDTFEVAGSQDDEITGGTTLSKVAYIFTKQSVHRVSHVGGNPDFDVKQVKNWGAVPSTIKRVTFKDLGEVIICLGWDRHVRIFDGADDRIVSDAIEEDNGQALVFLKDIPIDQLQKCHAEVDSEEQVYRLWMPIGSNTETSHCMCLNLRTGTWYPYKNQTFQTAVMAESGNSRVLLGVKRDGFVHWINTTNTDAGTAIDELYESPLLFGGTPREVRKYQKLNLYFFPTSSGTLYVRDRGDLNATWGPVRDQFALTDTTSKVLIHKPIDLPITENVLQFQLTSSASTATPWKLVWRDVEAKSLGAGKA